MLILLNRLIDRQVAAVAERDLKQQERKIASLQRDLREIQCDVGNLRDLEARLLVAKPRVAGRVTGSWLAPMLLLVESLPHLSGIDRKYQARLDITRLAFAAEVYRRDHGRYPPKLASLVPKYVATVPFDPMSENPLHYQQHARGFVLYSVGINGRDDGGRDRDSPDSDDRNFDDIVIRVGETAGSR